jgi:FkbM family methyltransferase
MLKSLLKKGAARLGYEVLPKWRLDSRAIGEATRRIFDRFEISTVIDVGANQGGYRDFLRYYLEWDGWIHSFEPDPGLAAMLGERTRSDPRWKIYPFALGAATGSLRLNIFSVNALNSFKKPKNFADYRLDETLRETRSVDVKRLDDIVDGWPELDRTFVKLDTQGFDLEVLAGGPACFAQVPALQTEINMFPMYEDVPDFYTTIARFADRGFAISDLMTIGQTSDLRAREFDCLMVRGVAARPHG